MYPITYLTKMPQYKVLSQILLILFIINSALAAPAVVREGDKGCRTRNAPPSPEPSDSSSDFE